MQQVCLVCIFIYCQFSNRKNDIVTSTEIRQFVTAYIKENNLQLKEDPKYFIPNVILTKLFLKKANAEEKIRFDEFFGIMFQKMTSMHQIKRIFKDKKIEDTAYFLRKGKYQPVEFKLESRGGNKKVTTIHNLATFEIDFQQLQQKLRKEIGCSVTLNEVENVSAGASMIQTKDYIVNIQGNQICQIANILRGNFFLLFFNLFKVIFNCFFTTYSDELGIQHKHMKGMELGVKNP